TKIPVLATIRAAYRFTFTHLGAIIGLIWLPMILATVIGFFVLQRFFSALADAFASNNFALAGPAILGLISFLLVGMLLFAMMAVPVVQLALGSRKSGALAHFAFGMAEWRLFRASLGVVGFVFALLLIVSTVLGAALGPRNVGANLVSLAIFYAAAIFFGLRFGFLLPGVAVEETGPVLPRSWILSNGNFWRMLGVFLAVVLPVRFLMVAVEVALEGPGILKPQVMTSTAMVAVQLHAENQNMPVTAGILFLIAPLLLGLTLGASAHAFQALKNPSA
ncbi:MAG TPA: hypothetical protein VN685_08920, partial [Rhizomicrobium sp.]|nr:hypothetical protein [Rhizomicrobium sp.]